MCVCWTIIWRLDGDGENPWCIGSVLVLSHYRLSTHVSLTAQAWRGRGFWEAVPPSKTWLVSPLRILDSLFRPSSSSFFPLFFYLCTWIQRPSTVPRGNIILPGYPACPAPPSIDILPHGNDLPPLLPAEWSSDLTLEDMKRRKERKTDRFPRKPLSLKIIRLHDGIVYNKPAYASSLPFFFVSFIPFKMLSTLNQRGAIYIYIRKREREKERSKCTPGLGPILISASYKCQERKLGIFPAFLFLSSKSLASI